MKTETSNSQNQLLKHCKTDYNHNLHRSYHHHAYHNHLWLYCLFHLLYPGQIFLQWKQFPNHLHLNLFQQQEDPSTRNVQIFCLILWLVHQNFKHLHHHFFAKCLPHCYRQLLTIPSSIKLITSPTSVSSSFETPQSSQLKF